jgi:sulfite oxidase
VFQKGEDPKSGEVVTRLKLKSIITQPVKGEKLPAGMVTILGAAYAGPIDVEGVDVSVDSGQTWNRAAFIGPHEPFAWRQWRYLWEVGKKGQYTLMSRATDAEGRQQPINAQWNVLGYGNNGVLEHAVSVDIV